MVAAASALNESIRIVFAAHDSKVVLMHVSFDKVVAWKRQVLKFFDLRSRRIMNDFAPVSVGDARNAAKVGFHRVRFNKFR